MKKATSKAAKPPVEEANDHYEACLENGNPITIKEVEEQFGLKAGQLASYRSNRLKVQKAAISAHVPESGKSALAAVALNGATLIRVPLNRVTVCPLNPRKKIDPAGIDEMARSILEHGIIQPPVARAQPKAEGYYEVVFGQRRLCGMLRAREIARAEKLPEPAYEIDLLLRAMDDRTVIEEAWIENLQRVDVSVRDEAQGFEDMLNLKDDAGQPLYTVRSLAQRLGKDRTHIARRLKLKGVPEPLWTALEEGTLGVRQLELVGCLPTQEMREKAAKAVLSPRFRTEPPMTVKETLTLIREEFMVSLRGVEWSQKDAELVPVVVNEKDERIYGGACHDCPFRSGANEELQDQIGGSGTKNQGVDKNSCMLPSCFEKKRAAIWKRTKAEAVESGGKVLTDQEAKKVFSQWGSDDQLERSSGMVVLSAKPGYEETGHYAGEETLPTWEKMIGDQIPSDEVVLARNPKTGAIKRLLPKKLAIKLAEAALKEKGKDSPFEKRKKEKEDTGPKEKPEWELKRMIAEKVDGEAAVWLRARQKEGSTFGELAKQELIVFFAMEAAEMQGASDVAEVLGIPLLEEERIDVEKAWARLETEVRLAASRGGGWFLLTEIAAATCGGFSGYNDESKTRLRAFYEVLGVPIEALEADAKKTVEAEEKARLNAGKKPAKKAAAKKK